MADDAWTTLAKKGYLGTKAQVAAESGEKHKCTPNCPSPCPKKNK